MDTWKKPFLFFLVSAVITGVGYVLTNSIEFGICIANQTVTEASCINFYERIGDALFYGAAALALVFILLAFIPKAWHAWNRFAMWYVPIATVLFIFYKDPGSGDLVSPYAETVFQWVSGVYVAISLLIVAFISVKKNRKS